MPTNMAPMATSAKSTSSGRNLPKQAGDIHFNTHGVIAPAEVPSILDNNNVFWIIPLRPDCTVYERFGLA
jgi:hypothetical protein